LGQAIPQTLSQRGTRLGLRALNRFAGLDVVDRVGLREPAERLIYRASKTGFSTAGAVGRRFVAAQRLARPARPAATPARGLFDLTPTDEQQMLSDSVRDFAMARVRPAAQAADAACRTPDEIVEQANELGLSLLGVPEELGGVTGERSAVSGVLVAEALSRGDMGIALACLASSATATAIALWGDADQQSRYLPAFAGDDPPPAAVAVLEPRPVFDPFALETRAERAGDGYRISGVKSLVPRAADAELFLVAADVEDHGPALLLVESRSEGVFVEPEPAMGLRAAATGRLVLENVRVPVDARLGGGEAGAYGDCIQLARIGGCALAVGTAQAVLDYVIPYVNDRIAFGEPISSRQAVAFAISDIAIELEGMRLATYRAASRADQGKSFAHEAAIAARLCADKGAAIGSEGVQLLGGHGYVKEHPVERWYRDLRAAGVLEGALLV